MGRAAYAYNGVYQYLFLFDKSVDALAIKLICIAIERTFLRHGGSEHKSFDA